MNKKLCMKNISSLRVVFVEVYEVRVFYIKNGIVCIEVCKLNVSNIFSKRWLNEERVDMIWKNMSKYIYSF